MLGKLQGNTHSVFTAIALVEGCREFAQVVETKVHFRPLSPQQIAHYVAQGESMDKAGAYGIQGKAAFFIEGIQGDYYNVMGLPLSALAMALEKFNIKLLGSEGPH